jgi:hypothetical protein
VIEKPRYGLSWFRISFGRLQLKAYTKGEHVLRFAPRLPSPRHPAGSPSPNTPPQVRRITGQDGYTTRQAAYDLRMLCGKQLIDKPGRTRRYRVPR